MSTRTPTRPRPTNLRLAALASGLTGIGFIGLGLVGVSEAVCFGAGGALTLMLVASGSQHHQDGLYPARIQLARCRRSGQSADILVVGFPASSSVAGGRQSRRCATAVSSVLRVTDGVSMVPSLGGNGLCAVLESDERARSAIDQRLRKACGNEIRLAWATSPDDGVTLESLLEVALNRLPLPESARGERPQRLRPLPVQQLLPSRLEPEREPMRSGH
jgi:hypothetical protein